MIAFFLNKRTGAYWTYNISMRPAEGDIIIGPDGDRYEVEVAIVHFSERIGTHYGFIMLPLEKDGYNDQQADLFIGQVTDDIFFNRQSLIVQPEVHFDEQAP